MKVIKKAFDILCLFITQGEMTLDQMSKLSGLNKPTVRRIALSLVECGLLKQPQKRGKYSLGMKFLDFSKAIKRNNAVMDIAMPRLIQLSRAVDETVSLALWDGIRAVIVQSIHPNNLLKVISNEGTILGLHYTSLGKAILAEMSDSELREYYKTGLERSTSNTITNLTDLKMHLMAVRQEGVSVDDEEYALGVKGIGAAIKDGDGKLVGAISILGPSVRLTRERMRECIPIVKACAAGISQDLGYHGI
jgi:DNA-binding IclR family transcriptional regulator